MFDTTFSKLKCLCSEYQISFKKYEKIYYFFHHKDMWIISLF